MKLKIEISIESLDYKYLSLIQDKFNDEEFIKQIGVEENILVLSSIDASNINDIKKCRHSLKKVSYSKDTNKFIKIVN